MIDPERLPDDLEEIARSIPPAPRGLGVLRQTLALLPWPGAANTQGSFPADEMLPPEAAAAQAGLSVGPGVGVIGPGAIADGAIGSGAIRDGAVIGAAFAATVRPVYLVTVLPTLPDPEYPPGQFVLKTNDNPPTLYENEANVWVLAIGAEDVKANSLTAGVIAAGAIGTSELAVGARLTGEVANETGATPGVFIDSTGILIRSGKLTLQDEFGATTMSASGFSGTWADFLTLGLYNALFGAGNAVALALGRTADLPYWTVSRDNDGATKTHDGGGGATITRMVATAFPSGFRLRAEWSAITDNAYITSDRVPIVAGFSYPISIYAEANVAAGSVTAVSRIRFLDKNGTQIGAETPLFSKTFSVTTAAAWFDLGTIEPTFITTPANARFAQVVINLLENVSHSASNRIDLGGVAFGPGLALSAFITAAGADLDDLNVSNLAIFAPADVQFIGGTVIFNNVDVDIGSTSDLAELESYSGNTPNSSNPIFGGEGTATFANDEVEWFKIGKIVFFRIFFEITANGSGGTALSITNTGLPPAASNVTVVGDRGGVNVDRMIARLTNGGGELQVVQIRNLNGYTVINGSDLVNGQSFSFHGMYLAA